MSAGGHERLVERLKLRCLCWTPQPCFFCQVRAALESERALRLEDIEDNRKLEAERDKLRAHVADLADELEAELRGRYATTIDHPAMRPRFERDMTAVYEARRALTPDSQANPESPQEPRE